MFEGERVYMRVELDTRFGGELALTPRRLCAPTTAGIRAPVFFMNLVRMPGVVSRRRLACRGPGPLADASSFLRDAA